MPTNEAIIGQAIGRASTAAAMSIVAVAHALVKKGLLTKQEIEQSFSVINEEQMDEDQLAQYRAVRTVVMSYL